MKLQFQAQPKSKIPLNPFNPCHPCATNAPRRAAAIKKRRLLK